MTITGNDEFVALGFGENVVLDLNGFSITLASGAPHYGIYLTHSNLTIKNGTIIVPSNGAFGSLAIYAPGIIGEQLTGLKFNNLTIYGGGVYLVFVQTEINDCKVYNAPESAGFGFFGANAVVTNCETNNCISAGFYISNQSGIGSNAIITNCRSNRNNTGFEIAFAGNNVILKNCSADFNLANGFWEVATGSSCQLRGNIAFGNGLGNYNLTVAPGFEVVLNGSQQAPGDVLDPVVDNISITG